MWSTITKYIISFFGNYVTDYWNVALKVLSYVLAIFVGFYCTYLYYGNKIQEIEVEHLQVIAQLKDKAIVQLQEREKETARIISERDYEKEKHETDIKRLNATISTLSTKLHNGNGSSGGKLSKSSGDSPKSTEELQRRSRELQERCFRLLVRGTDIAGRLSADKDAVVKLATQETQETK